ncbi:MAG: DKNYY domain-containing protein, partial [Duncaniella sp.]|nr:DKNYY domain-containing protein [Duncaniella sp.]
MPGVCYISVEYYSLYEVFSIFASKVIENMRNLVLIVVMTLGLWSAQASAQERHGDLTEKEVYDRRGHQHHRPTYFISDNKVFFDGKRVKGAVASSFEILRDGYAKDSWNVYYRGVKINGATSNSFNV